MISFVIPAHNEQAALPRTLDAIHEAARATGRPYEIVVANDASTDATAEVARQHGATVVDCNNRQIAATRNSGARAAKGDYLFFIDADTTANAPAVAASLKCLDNGAAGGGAAVWFDDPLPLYGRLLMLFVWLFEKAVGSSGGAFLFCTRQAWEQAGGFNQRLYCGEECLFIERLKQQGRFIIIMPRVTTSGRRLRSMSGLHLLATILRLSLSPIKTLTQQSFVKKIWYESDRSSDDVMGTSFLDRLSNGAMLIFVLVGMSGPLWNFIPWSWTPHGSWLGRIRLGIGIFLCHMGLIFWVAAVLLLWNLLYRKHWFEWTKTAAFLAFCVWQAWGATEGVVWTWGKVYHLLG